MSSGGDLLHSAAHSEPKGGVFLEHYIKPEFLQKNRELQAEINRKSLTHYFYAGEFHPIHPTVEEFASKDKGKEKLEELVKRTPRKKKPVAVSQSDEVTAELNVAVSQSDEVTAE